MAAVATPLSDWFGRRGVTLARLATRIGISAQHVARLRDGVTWPSDRMKLAIERETIAIDLEIGFAESVGVPAASWIETMKRAG